MWSTVGIHLLGVLWVCTLLFPNYPPGVLAGKKNRIRGVKWWSLANLGGVRTNVLNPTLPVLINPSLQPLTRRQRRLVAKNPGTVLAIAKGARLAINECQYQFRNRWWDCSTSDDSHGGSVFGKILTIGCRETAFIYAITSAAVTHQVARGCSEGSIYTCTCDYRHNNGKVPNGRDWEWGGCSDNALFGHGFSRDFVDVVERGRDLRYMMNLHNNEAGRAHVSIEMQKDCKCHGMSGSCTIKTCWMRLPPFRKVGTLLKDRFDGASRVVQGNSHVFVSGNSGRGRPEKSNRKRRFNLIPVNHNHKSPNQRDLVYYENSPNFCNSDPRLDFKGTTGRECNATSIGVEGCELMCCDRGYRTESYLAKERCSCTFHWCCKVTCKICTRTKLRHTCL